MRFKYAVVGCICLLLLGTAADCGGITGEDKEEEEKPPSSVIAGEQNGAENPPDVIRVMETEMSVYPDEITLERSGAYMFRAVNLGNFTHSLRIEGNGIDEQLTRNIPPNGSEVLEVTLSPGTYELYCPVGDHKERGMKATVTVAGD